MAIENVYELLSSEYPALVKRLATNNELCMWLTLVYAHVLNLAAESDGDPRDMGVHVEWDEANGFIVLTVFFKKQDRAGAPPSRFDKLFYKRSSKTVQLLQANENLKTLPVRIVELLDKWLLEQTPDFQREGFSQIRFEDQRLWKNLMFTARIIMKSTYDDEVRRKMGWDKLEEAEQEAEERRIILPS
jgi:hypothetical protein